MLETFCMSQEISSLSKTSHWCVQTVLQKQKSTWQYTNFSSLFSLAECTPSSVSVPRLNAQLFYLSLSFTHRYIDVAKSLNFVPGSIETIDHGPPIFAFTFLADCSNRTTDTGVNTGHKFTLTYWIGKCFIYIFCTMIQTAKL